MKHTKNMIYKRSSESEELYIFLVNDYSIYHNHILPAIENLKKKYAAGKYNPEKAIDLYYYITTEAARKYGKLYGNNNGLSIFNVTARYTAAAEMEKRYFEDIEEVNA